MARLTFPVLMQSLRMATCGVLPPNSGNVSPSVRRAFGAASREGLGRKSAPSPTCAQMMGALYGVGKPLRVSVRAQARRHCANRAGSPWPSQTLSCGRLWTGLCPRPAGVSCALNGNQSQNPSQVCPPPPFCRRLCAAATFALPPHLRGDGCVCVCVCVCVYQVVRNVKTGSEVTFPCHSCIGPNQQVRRAGRMCA